MTPDELRQLEEICHVFYEGKQGACRSLWL